MSHLTELKQRLEEYGTAELTAGALEDISAIRMQAIRSGFEKNKSFYEGIRDLYHIVQASSRATQDKDGLASTEKAATKQLFLALTSNKRFYGALMRDIIDALVRTMHDQEGTFVVIGRVGWQHLEESNPPQKAVQMFLEDDAPTSEEFEKLLQFFDQFDRVYVLYPKFINPFRQDVGIEDITQSPGSAIRLFEARTPDDAPKAKMQVVPAGAPLLATQDGERVPGYIFEPEVPAMISFFNAQVKRVLFDGVLLEAELSRTASRLIHMEEAEEHAHVLVRTTAIRLRRETAALSNAALLETFAGFARWKTV